MGSAGRNQEYDFAKSNVVELNLPKTQSQSWQHNDNNLRGGTINATH